MEMLWDKIPEVLALCYNTRRIRLDMTTFLLYAFTFSSWGVGLLAALTALSMKVREHSMKLKSMSVELEADSIELSAKRAYMSRLTPSSSIPEGLKNLINNSSSHPEVSEIEEGDNLYGVVFKGANYPPPIESDDNDIDNE